MEEKLDNLPGALAIIKKGLTELPRYGPLWFGLLRISEQQDTAAERKDWILGVRPKLLRVNAEAASAIQSISKELVWKVHFEVATIQERAADVACVGYYYFSHESMEKVRSSMYDIVRIRYLHSILSCPSNLRWKVLLVASRLELLCGNLTLLRKFLNRAWLEVPEKSRSVVYLECSRVEEYFGNISLARAILARARIEVRGEWKIFMESVMVEARQGHLDVAVEKVLEALEIHSGAGRLWSILIHLCHRMEAIGRSQKGALTKHYAFLNALSRCPKSGEVWCEGGRNHLNPLLLDSFDLTLAQRHLCFAAQFTPQYGDTFLELLRLETLTQILLPIVLKSLQIPVKWFMATFLSEDDESDTFAMLKDLPTESVAFNPSLSLEVMQSIEAMTFNLVEKLPVTRVVMDRLKRRYIYL